MEDPLSSVMMHDNLERMISSEAETQSCIVGVKNMTTLSSENQSRTVANYYYYVTT